MSRGPVTEAEFPMGAEERVFVSCLVTHGLAASREAQQPNSGLMAPAKQRALCNPALCSPAPNQTAQQTSPQA